MQTPIDMRDFRVNPNLEDDFVTGVDCNRKVVWCSRLVHLQEAPDGLIFTCSPNDYERIKANVRLRGGLR